MGFVANKVPKGRVLSDCFESFCKFSLHQLLPLHSLITLASDIVNLFSDGFVKCSIKRKYLKLGDDCFLPHPVQFIIHCHLVIRLCMFVAIIRVLYCSSEKGSRKFSAPPRPSHPPPPLSLVPFWIFFSPSPSPATIVPFLLLRLFLLLFLHYFLYFSIYSPFCSIFLLFSYLFHILTMTIFV